MNYFKLKHITTLVLLLFIRVSAIATNSLPQPRDGGFDETYVVGSAIDSYIFLLFLLAMVLGIVTIGKMKPAETK